MDMLGEVEVLPVSAGGEGVKRRAVDGASGGGSKQEEQAMLLTMGKLLLSTTLRTRIMLSILMQTIRVESSNPYIVAMKAATQRFAANMKKLREKFNPDDCRDKLGVPCCHACNAMVMTLQKDLKSTGRKELMSQQLDTAIARWGTEATKMQMKPWQYINRHIKVCRHEKVFDQKFRKLVVHCPPADLQETNVHLEDYSAVTPLQVWYMIKAKILSSANTKELPGIPPPGDLERQIQAYIDRMESKD